MATININGQVKYADLSPAQNVRVKIWELDPLSVNDVIFNQIVNADGAFSGTSLRWDDHRVAGVNVDLVAILEFEVTFEGVTHKGPYSNAVPIILPPTFPKPIQLRERDLVQIVYLQNEDYNAQEQALYGFIETGSAAAVNATLGDDYRRIHHLEGVRATLSRLKRKLQRVAERPGTDAVDLVFCTHGFTDGVVFANGAKTTGDVLTALLEIPPGVRAKFRMVFSTACFGTTHNQMWLDAGFKCASGSEGVYADSEFSLIPFLESWASRNTFNTAVEHANTGIIGNRGDEIAKEYYRNIGKADDADDINSHRIVEGNGNLRIYSKP